jgi:hypothetical protein
MDEAIEQLEAAKALAEEIDLPGEAWPILGALSALYEDRGDRAKARQARETAASIIGRLADNIGEAALREGFLASKMVRSVLDKG